MKRILLSIFLLTSLSRISLCASVPPSLGNEFTMHLYSAMIPTLLSIPSDAKPGVAAKVYSRFSIDEQGIIHDIVILHHQRTKLATALAQTVAQALKTVPKQLPANKGSYVLPCILGYGVSPTVKSSQSDRDELADKLSSGDRTRLPALSLSRGPVFARRKM